MTSSRRIRAHLNAAHGYARLSRAKRLQVGAVLVRDDRIISLGYNGTPSGMDNTCEWGDNKLGAGETKPEVVHAEMNAAAFATKNGIATDGATLITTHSPCYTCCKLLIQIGVAEVYYEIEYRDTTGLDLLKAAKVKTWRFTDDN